MHTVGHDKRLNYYRLGTAEVLDELKSHRMGLTNAEAMRRLEAQGPNTVPTFVPIAARKRFMAQAAQPVPVVLLLAILGALFLHDVRLAITSLAVLALNATAGFLLWPREDEALQGLSTMVPSKAKVVRNGETRSVPASDIVLGDIVALEEGDTVPADVRILQEYGLVISDRPLTGDHGAHRRFAHAIGGTVPLFARHNIALLGSSVTSGHGQGIVVATGLQAEAGRIVSMLQALPEPRARLQHAYEQFTATLAYAAVLAGILGGACALAAGLDTQAAVALGLTILLAAAPIGLAIAFALLFWQTARRHPALALPMHSLANAEAAGTTDILLANHAAFTAGEATASHLLVGRTIYTVEGSGYEPEGDIIDDAGKPLGSKALAGLALVFTAGALTTSAKVYRNTPRHKWQNTGTGAEAALLTLARKTGLDTDTLVTRYDRLRDIPYDADRQIMSTIRRSDDEIVVFARGSVAALTARSTKLWDHGHIRNFTKGDHEFFNSHAEGEAGKARHTVALAYRTVPKRTDINKAEAMALEDHLTFLGVVSIHQPLHDEASSVLSRLRDSGVAVSLLTSDDPRVAKGFATAAGLAVEGRAATHVDSAALEGLSDAQILGLLSTGENVFTDMTPEDMLRLVAVGENAGKRVAVGDASVSALPARRRASIAVTATTIVGFEGLVLAGRMASTNMREGIQSALTDHAALLVAILLGFSGQLFFHIPPTLTVIGVIVIALLTQALPIASLAWDEHVHAAKRPETEALVLPVARGQIAMFGLLAGALAYANFLFFFSRQALSPNYIDPTSVFSREAATIAFATLAACQAINLLFVRADRHKRFFAWRVWSNQRLLLAFLVSAFVIINILYNPFVTAWSGMAGLSSTDWVAVGLAALAYVAGRALQRHTRQHSHAAIVKLHRKVYGKNSAARV